MKKLLLTVALVGVASLAFGQGKVNFLNTGSTLIQVGAGGPAAGGSTGTVVPSYYYALLSAPAGTVNPSLFTFTGNYGTNQAVAGRFTGGQVGITGTNPGDSVSLIVAGWSSGIGTTWAQAQAWYTSVLANANSVEGYYGTSAIATIQLGGGATPITTPFGALTGQVGGFTLAYSPIGVPEPSTYALMALGLGGLLFIRRRK